MRVVAIVALLCGAVVLTVALMGEDERDAAPQANSVAPSPTEAAARPAPMADSVGKRSAIDPIDGSLQLVQGEPLQIKASDLPRDRPAVFALELPVPLDNDEPRAVRLIVKDRPPLEVMGTVHGEGRSVVRLEVEPTWLTPGRYIVEIKTTERTHFPLRRFILEVL